MKENYGYERNHCANYHTSHPTLKLDSFKRTINLTDFAGGMGDAID